MASKTDENPVTPDDPAFPDPLHEQAVVGEDVPVRYAVYDNTLLRFVSGVVDTREEADDLLALSPEAHDVEVREV